MAVSSQSPSRNRHERSSSLMRIFETADSDWKQLVCMYCSHLYVTSFGGAQRAVFTAQNATAKASRTTTSWAGQKRTKHSSLSSSYLSCTSVACCKVPSVPSPRGIDARLYTTVSPLPGFVSTADNFNMQTPEINHQLVQNRSKLQIKTNARNGAYGWYGVHRCNSLYMCGRVSGLPSSPPRRKGGDKRKQTQ